MKKYLESLKKELNKHSLEDEEVLEIIEDHEDMIREAINDGLKIEDIEQKFGNPIEIANEISKTAKKKSKSVNNGGYTLIQSFFIDQLDTILINTISDDIIYEEHKNETVEVLFKNISEEEYEVKYESNTLLVKNKKHKKGLFSFRSKSGKVLVKVPSDLHLETMNVSVVSGDIDITTVHAKNLNVITTSGDLELCNSQSDYINIKTVSGDANLEHVITGKADVSAVSGDIDIEDMSVKGELNLNTVSGDYSIEKSFSESLYLSTVSGDFIGREYYTKEVTLKSVSGDITIDNHDKSKEIKVISKRTLSGDIKIK